MQVISTDDITITIPPNIVDRCPTLLNLYSDTGDTDVVTIPLPYPSCVIYFIVSGNTDLPFDISVHQLCLLTEAANFLGYVELYQSCCERHRDVLKYFSVDVLRQLYHLPNDISTEDKLQLQKDNEPLIILTSDTTLA